MCWLQLIFDFKLVFNFEQTRSVTIFGEHGINGSYTMMANTFRALELHYTMIQFLIIIIMLNGYGVSFTFCATGAISNPYGKKT